MATTYTIHNFNPDVVPSRYKRDVHLLIQSAVAMGWKFLLKTDGTSTLVAPAPHEKQQIHLSVRHTSAPINQMTRRVMKYGNPLLVPDATSQESLTRYAQRTIENWDKASATEQVVPEPVSEPVAPEPIEEERTPVRRIINTQPMISKRGGTEGYASDIATQREYDDGSMDYLCVRCDYVGSRPLAMASHWKKHVHEDERNRGNHVGVIVPIERSAYQPTEERLESLAEAMAKAMEQGINWSDPEEACKQLAYAALSWDNDRRSRSEGGMRDPLSDTEILNRIRSLVDNGLYEAQRETNAELSVKIEALELRVTEAEADAQRARDTLSTFRALLEEETA